VGILGGSVKKTEDIIAHIRNKPIHRRNAGGGTLPIGTENQTVRYDGSNALVATDTLQTLTDGARITTDHFVGTDGRIINVVHISQSESVPAASSYNVGDILLVYSQTWIQERITGNWYGVCINDNGTKMGAAAGWAVTGNYGLFRHDGNMAGGDPADWTEELGFTTNKVAWRKIEINEGGDELIATALGTGYGGDYGGVVYSWDSGDTWTVATIPGGYDPIWTTWYAAAINHYGDIMYTGGWDDTNDIGILAVSIDYGETFTEIFPRGGGTHYNDKWYGCIAIDSSGEFIIVGARGGRLWLSTNTGTSFAEKRPAGDADKNWNCAAMDSDGSVVIVGVSSGRLYLSTDSCANWAEVQPAGAANKSWTDAAISDDGATIVVSASGDNVYISYDTGVTWEVFSTDAIRLGLDDTIRYWSGVDISPDGTKAIISAYIGSIYSRDLTKTINPGVYINIGNIWQTVSETSIQTVTGARDEPEGALKNLLTALATMGLIVDNTTAS
jgi:hypothetical protein